MKMPAEQQKPQSNASKQKDPIAVGFYSLGCAKNLVDSQLMAGSLLSEGLVLAPSPEDADVVIVNTCSFVQDARDESYDSIHQACALKSQGRCKAVVVSGCLPQRYRDDIAQQLPQVDAFIGLDELEDIASVVRRAIGESSAIVRISQVSRQLYEPRVPQLSLTGGPYAYLKIAEGCNHTCAFCAIPSIRGRHRSRPLSSIVAEAEKLLETGYRELVLISQDVTFYGKERGENDGLPLLLRTLGRIGGDFWIRLLYGYPTTLSDAILDTMAEVSQVCHYLDIPVQHASPEMLRIMKRADTVDPVLKMAKRARAAMPDVALRTTCLVGHPGETDKHFKQLLEYIEKTRFDHLGCFVFSPEEGTAAAGMPACPPKAEAEQRRERLMLAQQAIVESKAAARVGCRDRCLLEHEHPDHPGVWIGRTPHDAPEVDGCVYVENASNRQTGDIVSIEYTEPDGYDMIAVLTGKDT